MRVRHIYSIKKEKKKTKQPGRCNMAEQSGKCTYKKTTKNLERRKHFFQADAPEKQKKSAENFGTQRRHRRDHVKLSKSWERRKQQ